MFIGRTDAEASILWPPAVKTRLTGRPWCYERQKAGGKRDDKGQMVEWHHQLNGHEFEQAPADSEGQGSLGCCIPWGSKELYMIECLKNSNNSPPHRFFMRIKWSNAVKHTCFACVSCRGWLPTVLGQDTCFVSKVLLQHRHPPALPAVCGCFHNVTVEFRSCNRGVWPTSLKWLLTGPVRKSLPIPDSKHKIQ